jgi:hypothetical protein
MTTQYQSKEQQTSEQSKEYSKTEQKYTKEHFTANQGRTDVVVEKIENAPVVVEHHHHHTHTVIHPEVVREHDTTEIREVIKPVYEHIKTSEKEEYAGKDVKIVEKAEDITEAQRKLEGHHRDIQARADITHTEDQSTTVDSTKVSDVHSTHKVIEEVTPVIIRDVEHLKTIHKDEKLVEKIHHAPEVHKEELDITHKEGHIGIKEEHTGLKEGHIGIKEGHTRDTVGYKEGLTKEKHRHTGIKEGHTKDTHGLKEGHKTHVLKEGHTTKGTTGINAGHTTKGTTEIKEGHTTKTTGLNAGHTTKGTTEIKEEHKTKATGLNAGNTTKGTGLKVEQVKDTRIKKGVE